MVLVQRFFDRLQLRLHLWGLHRLAVFVGRFGTPAKSLGLCAIDFDLTFTKPNNPTIDVVKDVAIPFHPHDVN